VTKLSVNINKVATIRNARGGNLPDVVKFAIDCERFGADGITVHPRPDERHIRYRDVIDLKEVVTTELNIEGYPSEKFMELVLDVKPHQVTLVPDPPGALTSDSGWDTISHHHFLREITQELKRQSIRVSIFTGTQPDVIEHAAKAGADRVELYTEPYASGYLKSPEIAVADFVKAANVSAQCGLGLNAGHDLSLENLRFLIAKIPSIDEVSIGHALISEALYFGIEKTIQLYKGLLKL
jgi:pyridoxine 5-phosphate synthase